MTKQISRWFLLLAIVLAGIVACSDADPSLDPVDSGGGKTDVLADSGPHADAALPDSVEDPRAALRARSIFENLDFEEADAAGAPAHWLCQYFGEAPAPQPLCSVQEGGAVSGQRKLVIAPQVAVYQDAQGYGPGHFRFDLFARREGGAAAADAYAFGYAGADDLKFQVMGRALEPAADGWSLLWSGSGDVAGTDRLRLVVFNSSSAAALEIDDGIAVIDPQPLSIPGHLLRAEHASGLSCMKGSEPTVIWIPLPLDHGVQVPLHVGLEIAPPSAAQQIAVSYSLDEHGNLGALLEVPPDVSFSNALVRWEGVVLTREADTAELAQLYAATTDVNEWLAVTPVVQWDHPPLKSAVEQLVAGLGDAEGKLAAILGWTSAYVTNASQLEALDAMSVFETRNASCTGYANLSAAAGRVAGIPARTIANYLVGMAQQTHSVTELYLGPDKGWRMVEPQATAMVLPPDYAVVVHVNTPADEGAAAMDSTVTWAVPGVPLRSTVMPLSAGTRCYPVWGVAEPWPDCPAADPAACDNRATYQAALRGPRADLLAVFDRARAAWQKTVARFTSSAGPDPAEQALRAVFLQSAELADVKAALTKVEAL